MALSPINRGVFVNRKEFQLTLYRRPLLGNKYTVEKRYPIAVGMAGLSTDPGWYAVEAKGRNVDWMMPDSDWVEPSLRGTIIPGKDPRNPIKARWIGLANGQGIHGTSDDLSIGTRASHGCIRMHIPDVIELFDYVRIGMPIVVA
jgi:lipoprotein-anchoring transpeptidase ErfK/SrfK